MTQNRARAGRAGNIDNWVLAVGCLFAMAFTVWLTWGIWQPGIPVGDDNAAHVARTAFALDELYPSVQIDGWQPTFGIGYQEFLFVGPVFTWLAALARWVTLGTISNLDATKVAVVVSYMALPPAVAFLAWAFRLGKRAAGVAAILSLTLSTPLGGAGLQSIFDTGLATNQIGSALFCLAMGGIVLILRRPSGGRVLFTGVSVALVLAAHVLTTIITAFFAVTLLACAGLEWVLFVRGHQTHRWAFAWSRLRSLGLAALLAAALAGFVVVPMLAHGNLRGVSTAFPDVGLGERMPAIWKGEFLVRPYVAALLLAGILFEVLNVARRRPLSLTLVYTPWVFLGVARVFVWKLPGVIIAQQLTNRSWANVGIFAVLPLAHLISWLSGFALARCAGPDTSWPGSASVLRRAAVVSAGLAPVVAAVLVVVLPPKLGRESVRSVRPTEAMVEISGVLRDVVPDGARFVTQRLPGREVLLTGMTHPDFWLPAVSGKNTLDIWNPESSTVLGPVFEPEKLPEGDPYAEADKLLRWGVTHVVLLDKASVPGIANSPRFAQIWSKGGFGVYEVLPSPGQPFPSSMVSTGRPASARVNVLGPGHYIFEITADGATSATIGLGWSPKWHMTVNGQQAEPQPSDERVIALDVPSGITRIDLEYRSDGWDVLGRSLSLLALAGIVWWAVRRLGRARSPHGARGGVKPGH